VTRENENNNTDATTTTTSPEEPTIYWDLEDIEEEEEEEDIDGVKKQIFELEDNIFRSAGLSEAFQCGYNLGLNNSSLTREQISNYCNNQILDTENIGDLTTFGFNTIFIAIGIIIIGIGGGIWLIVRRRRRKARIEALSGVSMETMMTTNREEEQDHRLTTKKVLVCSIIVGLISGVLSFFIDWLGVLSMAAFVFASITVWYMFVEKLHGWKETRKKKREINIGYKSKYN
ncbi:MAG TPA: hypothetical protein VFH25_00920, partial [Nitrososphaeraceae archaeon]|nr:hypothetical protein [Nitrososphaeraceae archaeon]